MMNKDDVKHQLNKKIHVQKKIRTQLRTEQRQGGRKRKRLPAAVSLCTGVEVERQSIIDFVCKLLQQATLHNMESKSLVAGSNFYYGLAWGKKLVTTYKQILCRKTKGNNSNTFYGTVLYS